MNKSNNFYITTPIYYVNDTPHIGHAYTTILADVLLRFHKLAGDQTYFLTGTDEHGQKVQQAADRRGVSPQDHCDLYSIRFREAWQQLNIGYDQFIRTTDPKHKIYVQNILQKLWDKGQIYEQEYEGWYSVGEERFFTEKELVDGKDPISGRPVEKIREKNYFFKMSTYQSWLIEYIEKNPDFIVPDFRKNEVLGFLRQPLNDLCISRPKSRLAWGITLPFDADYVAYVWVDALFNYCSAVEGKTFPNGEPIWPATYHLLGKDILTTHAVYWTTMLKAMDMPMPKHILAHGWWLFDNARMSKTTGNVVNPMAMKDTYGVDAFRYFLIREMVVGQDASFNEEALVNRINSDLANDVGNGLSRIVKLAATSLSSKLTPSPSLETEEVQLKNLAEEVIAKTLEKIEQLKLSFAIEDVLSLIRGVNRYLEVKAPWKIAKLAADANNPNAAKDLEHLNTVLYHSAEALRIGFQLLSPIMPTKMPEALEALGIAGNNAVELKWGAWNYNGTLAAAINLFPRIDISHRKAEGNGEVTGGSGGSGLSGGSSKSTGTGAKGGNGSPITDPFSLIDLRVGQIESIEDHTNAESLYVMKVSFGNMESNEGLAPSHRTICAGLKKHCSKEELLGKRVVAVFNLKPANLRGVESQGMILAAENAQGKVLPIVPQNAQIGDLISLAANDANALNTSNSANARQPKADLTLKEFSKATLKVKTGQVYYRDQALISEHGPVLADAVDGMEVR